MGVGHRESVCTGYPRHVADDARVIEGGEQLGEDLAFTHEASGAVCVSGVEHLDAHCVARLPIPRSVDPGHTGRAHELFDLEPLGDHFPGLHRA